MLLDIKISRKSTALIFAAIVTCAIFLLTRDSPIKQCYLLLSLSLATILILRNTDNSFVLLKAIFFFVFSMLISNLSFLGKTYQLLSFIISWFFMLALFVPFWPIWTSTPQTIFILPVISLPIAFLLSKNYRRKHNLIGKKAFASETVYYLFVLGLFNIWFLYTLFLGFREHMPLM